MFLVKESKLSFGKGWHDNPDVKMISETTQGLLTYVMNQIVESEVPDNELREAAAFCGYRFIDNLLAFIDEPTPDGMSWNEAMEQFIAGVDGKSK